MIYSAGPKSHSLPKKQPQSDKRLLLKIRSPSQLDEPEFSNAEESFDQFDLVLATRIISRIESRLPGRIRHLTAFTTENAVILSGECSTFYTKQIAQHAAMGVLEYEQLINNIDVRVAK